MSDIIGTSANDQLFGGPGSDWLSGGGGNDVLHGDDGDDFLDGDDGADQLYGDAGNDILSSGPERSQPSVDILTGGLGADRFMFYISYYGGVSSTLASTDHVQDFNASEGDRIDLGVSGYDKGYLVFMGAAPSAGPPTLGMALPDSQPNTQGVWTLESGGVTYLIIDNDRDQALSQLDFVLALDGAPTITRDSFVARNITSVAGTENADNWTGTADEDRYYGLGGADLASGGEGADQLYGGAGDDTLYGGEAGDTLQGDSGNDTLYGGAGDDQLYAGLREIGIGLPDTADARNFLYGEEGNDTLVGGAGVDVLDGGAGNDYLSDSDAGSADTLLGGDGADTLVGGATDRLNGGDGADTLTGGVSQDGGAGDDKLTFAGAKTAAGGAGVDVFFINVDSPFSTAAKDWSGFTTITDFKSSEGDRLRVSFFFKGYNDLVFRGAADAGFSLENGKAFSSDTYGLGFLEAWTWTTGGDTYLIIDTNGDGKLSANDYVLKLQGVTSLSLADFTANSIDANFGFTTNLGGSNAPDTFAGTAGSDKFYGLGGDDVLHGGDGVDHLYGGAGADQIWGDAGDDDLQGNLGDDTIYGGDGADVIGGGGGNDVIHGGAGNDQISTNGVNFDVEAADAVNIVYGEDGDDTISGGYSGRDQLHGGDGKDRVFGTGELWGDAGDDTLSAGGKATMHGGDGDDELSAQNGSASATMYGDAGKDTFLGGPNGCVFYVELGDRSVMGSSGKDTIYIADVRAGETATLTTIYGEADNDTFVITGPLSATLTLRGGSNFGSDYGDDLLDLGAAAGVTRVDLNLTTAQDVGMGRLILLDIDSVRAGDHGSVIVGDANANRLIGGAAGDTLSGGGGSDVLTGNGGDDTLDGGDSLDIAAYAGASTDYSWTRNADGTVTVKDLRANRPDGTDTLRNFETLQFSDKSVAVGYSLPMTVATAFTAILRTPVAGDAQFNFGVALANRIYYGLSSSAAILQIVNAAGATTSVASLAYEFFTGKIPGQAGIDYLVSPTSPNGDNLNSAYYAQFNTVNRYINFAVNLGKNGEAKDSFAAKYGALNLFDATKEAYKTIFGGTPTDAKVHALIDGRVDYLASYGGDGANGVGTKAAMVGFLLAAAATEDLGVMARSNDAWLTDLADGSAPFAVDILDLAKGYYKADFVFGG
jgi:Ca2+-binding RTX toxin-like protein